MPYCSKCGVEVDEAVETCPLCGAPIQHLDQGGRPVFKPYPDHIINPDEAPMSLHERMKLAIEVLTVFFGIGLIVITMVDLILNHGFTWSLYPAAALVYLWLCLSMPVFLSGKPWLVFSVLGPSTLLFVFLMDVFDGRITWYLSYGLPITILAVATVLVVAVLSGISKRKGLNVAAFILLGTAVMSMGIDIIVELNMTGHFRMSWSIIAAFVLIPVAILFIYLHYRITKRVDLKKVFHI